MTNKIEASFPNEWAWVEKYRPVRVRDCVLPDRYRKMFQGFVDAKRIPNMLLSGGPGVGKTTVAKAMCQELGVDWLYLNSSKERGIDVMKSKIASYAATMSMTGAPKVVILDEADYITPEAQAVFRGLVEEFSHNCTFILTCNYPSKLMEAISSRCTPIEFKITAEEKQAMLVGIFMRIEQILKTEGISYSKPAVVKVVSKYYPDFRATINKIQHLANLDGLQDDVVDQFITNKQLDDLTKILANKDFKGMRDWVGANAPGGEFYRTLYDSMYKMIEKDFIPMAVLVIAKYQYQDAFALDKEINTVACLTELMADCQFNV